MKVNEIFQSISGEVGNIPQGAITWFIRFQGCNLECDWCDTERAQNPDEYSVSLSPEEIAAAIPENSNVVLTGGEPLLQNKEELHWLVSILDDKGCIIQVETNGSQRPFLPVICHIFDYKTPSSGMQDKMMPLHCFLECPGFSQTWIKFVIKNLEDLEFTISVLKYFDWLTPGWNGLQIALSIDSGEEVQNAMNRLKETFPSMMHKIVFNFQLHKHFNLK